MAGQGALPPLIETLPPKGLLLAPMEGLLDFVLRDILTRVGGIDRCVSEFIRVSNTVLPDRVFLRYIPELAHGGRTLAGVPVRAQLLGSDPVCLADNAAALAAMGPAGIDINFGCPAKVVNRHGGGAALLDEPELVGRIVAAVRAAVPAHLPVSAKMRLGYNDDGKRLACAQAIAQAGACELVVHARTKADGYRPPAYWQRVQEIRDVVKIPVVANGEIWTVEDALRCRAESGCDQLMLGRGIVADPGLAFAIRAADGDTSAPRQLTWSELLPLIAEFWKLVCATLEPRQKAGRLKQWLNFLRRRYPEAEAAFQTLRTVTDLTEIDRWLAAEAGQI
ncbi:tRNA dihydrouridine synthase [Variovorax sp. HJSM1_2]|uniref:tRNA dihydrouridine synthase n=1 Tax=Variovorax sp. HJSM1_2 TaxID=3366263 RepID=UPI003BEB4EB8